jgi:hypothetical protein
LLLLTAITPLGGLWLGRVSALPPPLVALGSSALWFGILVPAVSAGHSLYQGALVHSHQTRGVSESVTIYLLVTVAVLGAGVLWGRIPGLPVGLAAMMLGGFAQVAWLRVRAHGFIRQRLEAERASAAQSPAA